MMNIEVTYGYQWRQNYSFPLPQPGLETIIGDKYFKGT